MSKNKAFLILVGLIALPLSIVTLFATNKNQFGGSGQVLDATATPACTTPGTVTNVKVTYPYCQGNNCSFTQASCTWNAVSGAASYSVKVTEVDTSTVIQNTTMAAPTTITTFNIVQGRTYKCDVSAVNACGTTGGTGSDSVLCQISGQLQTTASPTTTSASTIAPTAAPTAAPLPCGVTSCGTVGCQTGFVCMQTVTGITYCGNPAYQTACQQNPSATTCCIAQAVGRAPQPTMLPSGNTTPTKALGIGGIALIILGGVALFSL